MRFSGLRVAQVGMLAAAGMGALTTIAVARKSSALQLLDEPLEAATEDWVLRLEWPVDVARSIGKVTQPWLAGVGVGLLSGHLWRSGQRAAAGMLATSGILGGTTTNVVKRMTARQRPFSAEGKVVDMNVSYPSGHASAGIYLFLSTGLVLIRLGHAPLGAVLVVVGPLIGVSRIVLGAHWVSDVVGGWAFGSTAVLTSSLVFWDGLSEDALLNRLAATGDLP